MHIIGQVKLSKGQLCPAGIRIGPLRVRAGARNRKKHPLKIFSIILDPKSFFLQIGKGLEENRRGGGIMFGSDVTAKFLNRNNLQCLIRWTQFLVENLLYNSQLTSFVFL